MSRIMCHVHKTMHYELKVLLYKGRQGPRVAGFLQPVFSEVSCPCISGLGASVTCVLGREASTEEGEIKGGQRVHPPCRCSAPWL